MKEHYALENIHDIVKRLTGNIQPIGDSGIDEIRYDNLVEVIGLTENILNDIILVAANKGSSQHSVSRAGIEADNFITHLREKLMV